jgi:hypothetical protein
MEAEKKKKVEKISKKAQGNTQERKEAKVKEWRGKETKKERSGSS